MEQSRLGRGKAMRGKKPEDNVGFILRRVRVPYTSLTNCLECLEIWLTCSPVDFTAGNFLFDLNSKLANGTESKAVWSHDSVNSCKPRVLFG